MFSRNYLGVHTFADVFVSLVFGIVMIVVFDYLLAWVDAAGDKSCRDIVVCIVDCVILLLPMLRFGCLSNAGAGYGFLVGWLMERRFVRFDTSVSLPVKLLRFMTGALVLFICFTSGTTIFSHIVPSKYAGFFLQAFASFFIMFVHPMLFRVWERKFNNTY